jgi:hypothetical protein
LKLAESYAASIFKGETSGCTGKRYEINAITVNDQLGTVYFSGLKMEDSFNKRQNGLFILEYK